VSRSSSSLIFYLYTLCPLLPLPSRSDFTAEWLLIYSSWETRINRSVVLLWVCRVRASNFWHTLYKFRFFFFFFFHFISLCLRASVHAYFALCFTPFQFVLSYFGFRARFPEWRRQKREAAYLHLVHKIGMRWLVQLRNRLQDWTSPCLYATVWDYLIWKHRANPKRNIL
jgi:hypothetical protein